MGNNLLVKQTKLKVVSQTLLGTNHYLLGYKMEKKAMDSFLLQVLSISFNVRSSGPISGMELSLQKNLNFFFTT